MASKYNAPPKPQDGYLFYLKMSPQSTIFKARLEKNTKDRIIKALKQWIIGALFLLASGTIVIKR